MEHTFSFDGAVNIRSFIQALQDSIAEGCSQYSLNAQNNEPKFIVTNQANRQSNTCSFQCDSIIDLELTNSIESLINTLSEINQTYLFVDVSQDSVDMIFS